MQPTACLSSNPNASSWESFLGVRDMMEDLATFDGSTDPILLHAQDLYLRHLAGASALAAKKQPLAKNFDVLNMKRIAAICHYGRSGSLLLASFLDNHDDVVMLPYQAGEKMYEFYERYNALSLWQKLAAYPSFVATEMRSLGDFFLKNNPWGNFSIEPEHYFAAVQAIFDAHCDKPPEDIDTRAAFIQFLHATYDVALGRYNTSRPPLIIFAQHWLNNSIAKRLVEDFPNAKFLHTIRDPITAFNSWYPKQLEFFLFRKEQNTGFAYPRLDAACATAIELLSWDHGHQGMESRSRAVRFEDMHLAPEKTMRSVAAWLGISYSPVLLESTWNGNPYVLEIRGKPASGADPNNAVRRSDALSQFDQFLIFALLYRHFEAWNYPVPRSIRFGPIRLFILLTALFLPTQMELTNARNVVELVVKPALHSKKYRQAFGALLFLLVRRARMIILFASEGCLRIAGKRRPIQLLEHPITNISLDGTDSSIIH